jgi:hypothetical protein
MCTTQEIKMNPISEIEAIKTLDSVLSGLEDAPMRARVLKWALDKYGAPELFGEMQGQQDARGRPTRSPRAKASRKPKSAAKVATRLSIVKDMSLTPKGKKSFKDFATEKAPTDNQEKCTVAAYYLTHELGLTGITIHHIFTCYKTAKWKPADIYNVAMITASRKGWLDTSDMSDIKLTPHGEYLVESELPRKTGK